MTAPGSLPWAVAPEENPAPASPGRGVESGPAAGDAKAFAEDLTSAEADGGVRSGGDADGDGAAGEPAGRRNAAFSGGAVGVSGWNMAMRGPEPIPRTRTCLLSFWIR